jgi:hypothetical protein
MPHNDGGHIANGLYGQVGTGAPPGVPPRPRSSRPRPFGGIQLVHRRSGGRGVVVEQPGHRGLAGSEAPGVGAEQVVQAELAGIVALDQVSSGQPVQDLPSPGRLGVQQGCGRQVVEIRTRMQAEQAERRGGGLVQPAPGPGEHGPDRSPRITAGIQLVQPALLIGQLTNQAGEQWQVKVSGSGRIWYLPDDDARTVWVVYASAAHPKETD